ncbi:hypothetical protein [Rheinheimera sp.]|uniref:tetratricopeptide repeat protein n=1 Tax=Rheinheimera sp. TaxID=1869214 RepID=UPI00307ED811
MMLKKLVLLSALAFSAVSQADVLSDIKPLQERWAEVNYSLAEKAKEQAFAELVAHADQVVATNPGQAEALIWRGIIKSSYAGAKGGLGALGLCEESKADLEKALELNPTALQGSAYTSLGALYFKVPGWPLGFGSDKKARQLLEKAVSLNPQGIDPNYFYAEFLTEEREYKKAWEYLQKAKQAPARPDRLSADAGRQQEIALLEQKLQKKLKKS